MRMLNFARSNRLPFTWRNPVDDPSASALVAGLDESSLPLVRSGKFRALAKLNNRPLPALPDVPPLSVAAGMPALEDMSSWIAFVAPAGTPRAVIDKIQGEVARMYADPAIYAKLEQAGINPVSSTPDEFDAFFRQEAVRWKKAFDDSGIKLD